MQITIIDPNVSITMNVFLSIANIINLIYNIPQMVKTYKTKSTKDFSSWFIFLRIFGNIIWIFYAIDIDSIQMLVNTSVTVSSSIFIGYYKCNELYYNYKKKYYEYKITNDNIDEILLNEENDLHNLIVVSETKII
jgi:uncharacterized protein with PQ loop repeat